MNQSDSIGSPLDHDQARLRQEIASFILGSSYPATKGEVVAGAEDLRAPEHVLGELRQLPDQTYDRFETVWEALGGTADERY